MLLIALVVAAGALVTPAPDSLPLYDNLGSHSKQITTTVPLAQRYFDQGLRLTYGFNHGEAIRAFTRATELDPKCAMCYWGIAYALGPHVNGGMDAAAGVQAYAAVRSALAFAEGVTPQERAYIEALARRYAEVPPDDRAHLDSAYASAMAEVARSYSEDGDAAALYAEALMDLRPWNYWTSAGEPYPGTETIVSTLERVLQSNPDHPGACHFYIHAVEAVNPELAVPCAERLAQLMPGVGHMVHMPAHIYIRVGRYADAIMANEHAIHTDETYMEGAKPEGAYPLAYYPHNIHFLAFVATLAGRSSLAMEAARNVRAKVDPDVARAVPDLEEMIPFDVITALWFGKWDDVLAAELPPADLRMAFGMASYARGVALAAKGDAAGAAAALDTVRALAAAAGSPMSKSLMDIATHALMGEIAFRGGDAAAAIPHFQIAARMEDELLYFEPPKWPYPVRHSLGAALLKGGRPADAQRVYEEDLKRFPNNGWSLHGLAQALRAQGKTAEAEAAEARFRDAWQAADVVLTSGRD